MKPAALLLATLAALWVHPTHAQSDFLTLQENVDPSGTALMCPTAPDNYVDCADAGSPSGASGGVSAAAESPLRLSAHRGRDRHRHREAGGRDWHDRLYLRARGERHHRERNSEHVGHSHSHGMWVE